MLIKIHATTIVKEDPDMRASSGANSFLKPNYPILGQELAGMSNDFDLVIQYMAWNSLQRMLNISVCSKTARWGHLPFTGAIICQGAASRTLPEHNMAPMDQ
jgi:hypothetical protein